MKSHKTRIAGIAVALSLLVLSWAFNRTDDGSSVAYSDFWSMVESGKVTQVTIEGDNISGQGAQGPFRTFAPRDPGLLILLKNKGVRISARPQETSSWFGIFLSWIPMLLLVGVWIFFVRRMQGGGGNPLSLGKSQAKLISDAREKVTFEDVAGIDEAREELQEIVDYLRDPGKYTRLGGRIPKGVLLVGVPGTGKTLLARAIAGAAGVPFFSTSGSSFVEMFAGIGASRVRDLFREGKKNAPCIIFLDEIDAVGRHRGAGLGSGHDEKEQTLNQLLVEMDGFESNEGVILISATNRPDVLDPALLRPGRFDRQIIVPVPDMRGRVAILKIHVKKTPLAGDVDIRNLARGIPGFTGADIENMVNEAAIMAAVRNGDTVEMADFEKAKDKVMLGSERKSMLISDEEKTTTAYHEAGHTLVAMLLPDADPIHKVTIIPRGRFLGLTRQIPLDEKQLYSKEYLASNICILMGGRAAEEMVFHTPMTGAQNDIEEASDLARKMVCEYGLSEKLGPLSFGKKEEQVFLGRELTQHRDYSEVTAQRIDEEVGDMVTDAYRKARDLIGKNGDALHAIAKSLLERETMSGREIGALMASMEKTRFAENHPSISVPSR